MGPAFRLGVVVGALLAFKAGGSHALWRQAHGIAMEHVSKARKLRSEASGGMLMLAVLVIGGMMIMIFGS